MNTMEPTIRRAYDRLHDSIRRHDSMVIAYSGGVDSGLLAFVAHRVLGERALPVIAVSDSLAARERDAAERFLRERGITYRVIHTDEMANADYRANAPNRCYFCKAELFTQLEALRAGSGFACVAYGANLDDRADHRPGAIAADEARVAAPLAEAGLSKQVIRDMARALDLPLWDKPAAPCLASRIPYQQGVTPEKLKQVEAAEDVLHDLGFRVSRVRHYGDVARIEVPIGEHERLREPATWARIERGVREAGFRQAVLEPDGFRSGRLNAGITPVDNPANKE